jgi:hypothetical protein
MSGDEWDICSDPTPMLEFLRGKASDRKLRLFACACCRRIGHMIINPQALNLLKVAEQFADQTAGDTERHDGRQLAQQLAQGKGITRAPTIPKWERRAISTVYYALARNAGEAAVNSSQIAHDALIWRAGGHLSCDWRRIKNDEDAAQAHLLRDIFGNPFQPIAVDAKWRTPNVIALAQTIYEKQAFHLMPELDAALEQAGCTDAEVLAHCRQYGDHVRGCWLIDLLLGKE